MPKRSDAELAEDIREAIARIALYTQGMTYGTFFQDIKTQDAVVRNLEILGEAAKGLSAEFRRDHAAIRWQDIAGMRDRLIHHYAGVNWSIVWNVIEEKLPELRRELGSVSNGE